MSKMCGKLGGKWGQPVGSCDLWKHVSSFCQQGQCRVCPSVCSSECRNRFPNPCGWHLCPFQGPNGRPFCGGLVSAPFCIRVCDVRRPCSSSRAYSHLVLSPQILGLGRPRNWWPGAVGLSRVLLVEVVICLLVGKTRMTLVNLDPWSLGNATNCSGIIIISIIILLGGTLARSR